jgi:photosystem I subunit 10
LISSILLTLTSSIPATPVWSPIVAIIISTSSLVVLLLTFALKIPQVGPQLPVLPVTIPTFIGAMAFGHIIGVGIVLGLSNIGSL